MKPSLSIVIPTHNRIDLLRLCLAAVTCHAPPETEILVVNDGGDDRIPSLLHEFGSVRYLHLPQRRGFAVAANAGIRHTRGAIVELLNDDTEVQAGWAAQALRIFDSPDVGAVAPLVLQWPDGTHIDSAGDCYDPGGFAQKRGHGERFSPLYEQPREVFGASASSAFYRRTALDRAGLFPESFGSYFEDVDLSFRLRRAGFRIMYEPSSRLLHRGGASHGKLNAKLVEQQSLNEERVFWRNVPRATLPWAVPRHLAVLLGKAWRRLCEGTFAPFVRGRWRILREAAALRACRRELCRLDGIARLGR